MAASKKTLPFSRLRYTRSRKNGLESKKAAAKSSTSNESSTQRKNHAYPPYFTVDDLASYRRKKIPEKLPDNLRPLSGKFSDYKSEYKKKFRSFVIPGESTLNNWKKKKMKNKEQGLKAEGEIEFNVEYYDSFVEFPVQRVPHAKPRDQWENYESTEFSSSTEHKEKYIMFKEARKAALMRRSTNLKIEGGFHDTTENKEKFVTPVGSAKPELTRRNTTLKLEGGMDLSTETNEKYKEFVDVPRTKLMRRYSNLEIPSGAISSITEYNGCFTYPRNAERTPLIRSMENLHTEGEMYFDPEYARNFIDFHVTYPDIKFKKRNRIDGDNPLKNVKHLDLHVKDTIRDGTVRRNPSPEYKHSFIRYPVQRPTFKRPSSNLTPPNGIEEKQSELNAKYQPFCISQRTQSLRPSTHLKSEGQIELSPEYKASFIHPSHRGTNIKSDCKHDSEKSAFTVLHDPVPETNCNSTRTFNNSADKKFQKGKRLPSTTKKCDEMSTTETSDSEVLHVRPPFRMEVTNPDVAQNPYDKLKYDDRPFVVLDENNNENQWIRNKQKHDTRRWSPSWTRM